MLDPEDIEIERISSQSSVGYPRNVSIFTALFVRADHVIFSPGESTVSNRLGILRISECVG